MARTGGGVRLGGVGGGGSVGGMAGGMPSTMPASSGSSISGGGGKSGCTVATGGRAAGGGGTNTLVGVDFRNQHEVLPSDNARMSNRSLSMVDRRRELEAEGSSPAQLACKVDSTIM